MRIEIILSATFMLLLSCGYSNNKSSDNKDDDFRLQRLNYVFSNDSLYIEFGGYFDKDFVQFYNNGKIEFSDTLTSDKNTSYAKGISIKRESENEMLIVINSEHRQVIKLDTSLNFIAIWPDKHKKPQFEIRNGPVILE